MTIHHGQNEPRKTPGRVYAWRFVAGHPMSGVRKTNYTFRYRATRDLTDHGRASRWSHRAGWERSAWRIGASAITLATLYGYLTARTLTVDSVYGAFAALTVASIVRARYAFMNSRHHKRVVRPLWETMTLITSASTVHPHAYGDNHKQYIKVPRNYRDDKARIRLAVPPTWEARPAEVKRLTDLVERRLGGDWDAIPRLSEYPPVIEFIPSPAPPGSLTFAEIRTELESGSVDTLILGKGTHNRTVSINLLADSPHVAASIASGGGKSALLTLIVAQQIHHGCERIDICDLKRISLDAFRDVPRVYIHRTALESMNAISQFRKRMEDRYSQLERDPSAQFPRQLLVLEETNSLADMLRQYWEDYRASLDSKTRGNTPRRNPALSDLAYILYQGRAANMNVIAVFQRFSANSIGGADLREQFGARLLARYSAQTWKMLTGISPAPRSSRIPGRMRYVIGDEYHELQVALTEPTEAREFALAGIRSHSDPLMTVPVGPETGADDESHLTLRELCERGIIPMRYSSATRARSRADDFPEGKSSSIGRVYRPSDITAWFAGRSGKRGK